MDPMDAHLFADYKCAITHAVSYTSHTNSNSPQALQDEKYSLSKAEQVRATMLRVWKWSPTPQRIVQDITRWPATLQRVLDANGAKLPKKARGKRARTREFKPPPDCPLTTAALHATFRELDSECLPPKKRGRAR